jgi:hypothetical protein
MALTASDIQVLTTYKNNQDRFNYWNYLAQKGDPYAKLALSVVTNETLEGYIANQYAAGRASDLGKTLTDQQHSEIRGQNPGSGLSSSHFQPAWGAIMIAPDA